MTHVDKGAQTALLEELLQSRFDEADHKTFAGRGGRPMTYVEDETVMDRLDLVLGFGNWQVAEVEVVHATCVRLTLGAKHPETGAWTYYSDFGYATNGPDSTEPSKEPLKEAWTDAFRRAARLLGVARYVYAGEVVPTTQGQAAAFLAAPAPTAPAAPPQPVAVPQQAPFPQGAEQGAFQGARAAGDRCPVHGWTWGIQKGGVARGSGKPYPPFYKCGGKTAAGAFCSEKPSDEWIAAHPIAQ
jgi:Rad52/22 family double-strand break repair protein